MQVANTTNTNGINEDIVVATVPTYNNITNAQSAVPVYSVAGLHQVTPIITAHDMAPYTIKGRKQFIFVEQPETVAEAEVATEPVAEANTKVRAKGFSYSSALTVLLAVATLVVLVIGKFVGMLAEYTALVDASIGYSQVELLINNIINGTIVDTANIIPLCVAIVAVCSVLTIVACLIRLTRKGVCIFAKITIFITLLASVGILVYALISALTLGIGLYIICGISFVQAVLAVCAKRYKKI